MYAYVCAQLLLAQMNDLLGSIRKLGEQAKDGENAMQNLKKTANIPKSGGGRGDLLTAIQQGIELKPPAERKDREPRDARPRRMSLHDVMAEGMGRMRGMMGAISDEGSVSSDTDVSD